MVYGYIRVSSADQNLDRQMDCMMTQMINGETIDPDNIFADKMSGKDFERTSYNEMLDTLEKGDLLVIKSIDRLGRNYDMIIEQWQYITRTLGADILVLDMPLLDTRGHGKDLTGRLISDIVLQVLSYVAQKERENIRERQREGIASAMLRGKRFGRPTANIPGDFIEVVTAYRNKELTFREVLEITGMKKATFYRHVANMCTDDNT